MIIKTEFRKFKQGIKIINSSMLILNDAINNQLSFFECHNIVDNIDLIISKSDEIIILYSELAPFLRETEECLQFDLQLQNIKSLLKILKYSLKAKRSKITFEDIANCINTIMSLTTNILKYSENILLEIDDTNNENIIHMFI